PFGLLRPPTPTTNQSATTNPAGSAPVTPGRLSPSPVSGTTGLGSGPHLFGSSGGLNFGASAFGAGGNSTFGDRKSPGFGSRGLFSVPDSDKDKSPKGNVPAFGASGNSTFGDRKSPGLGSPGLFSVPDSDKDKSPKGNVP